MEKGKENERPAKRARTVVNAFALLKPVNKPKPKPPPKLKTVVKPIRPVATAIEPAKPKTDIEKRQGILRQQQEESRNFARAVLKQSGDESDCDPGPSDPILRRRLRSERKIGQPVKEAIPFQLARKQKHYDEKASEVHGKRLEWTLMEWPNWDLVHVQRSLLISNGPGTTFPERAPFLTESAFRYSILDDCMDLDLRTVDLFQSDELILAQKDETAIQYLKAWLTSTSSSHEDVDDTVSEDSYEFSEDDSDFMSPQGKRKHRGRSTKNDDETILDSDLNVKSDEELRSITLKLAPTWATSDISSMIIYAPPASFKTTLISKFAKELDMDIMEVGPHMKRSASELKTVLGDVSKHNSNQRANPFQQYIKKKAPVKPRGLLIVLEDVDVMFQEDAGFWKTVLEFAKITRRPVLLTTSNLVHIPRQVLAAIDRRGSRFGFCYLANDASFEKKADYVSRMSQGKLSSADCSLILREFQYDLRRAFNQLRFPFDVSARKEAEAFTGVEEWLACADQSSVRDQMDTLLQIHAPFVDEPMLTVDEKMSDLQLHISHLSTESGLDVGEYALFSATKSIISHMDDNSETFVYQPEDVNERFYSRIIQECYQKQCGWLNTRRLRSKQSRRAIIEEDE
jgi:hypothetical protein